MVLLLPSHSGHGTCSIQLRTQVQRIQGAKMNLLEFIKTVILDFSYKLNPNLKLFLSRIGLWVALSYIFIRVGSGYLRASTNFRKIVLLTAATFTAFAIPLAWVVGIRNPSLLLILVMCCLSVVYLPAWTALWVTAVRSSQFKIMITVYSIEVVLFILQLMLCIRG